MQKWINTKAILGLVACICLSIISFIFLKETQSKASSTEVQQNSSQPALLMKNIDLTALQQQGFWHDEKNQLLWFRCHIGQRFENQRCVGDIALYDFNSAQAEIAKLNQAKWQGQNTWRLPEIAELHALIQCSTGFIDQTSFDKKQTIQHGCKPQNYKRPTLDTEKFPATQSEWYWSATRYQAASSAAAPTVWGAYLSSGYVYDLNKDNKGYVYIVSSVAF